MAEAGGGVGAALDHIARPGRFETGEVTSAAFVSHQRKPARPTPINSAEPEVGAGQPG